MGPLKTIMDEIQGEINNLKDAMDSYAEVSDVESWDFLHAIKHGMERSLHIVKVQYDKYYPPKKVKQEQLKLRFQ